MFHVGRRPHSTPIEDDLAAALRKVINTQTCPQYLRVAAAAWLALRPR